MNTLSTATRTPNGWGIGIPLQDDSKGTKTEPAPQRIERVLSETLADWYQTWTPIDYAGLGKFVPASEDGDVVIADLQAAKNNTLLILCEPERGWHQGIKTPSGAGLATTRQLARLWQLGAPFSWAAPSCNINGANLAWLADYASWLWNYGQLVPSMWAIHLYGKKVPEINYHLQRFWDWYARSGHGRPVVITEFGPGGGATIDEALSVMEFGRRVLDDKRVTGVCFFAGGVSYEGHPDVCAEPKLLKQFRDLR